MPSVTPLNVLMSFGAVAVAAGIIALEPAFSTGAALGVALVAIGIGISFLPPSNGVWYRHYNHRRVIAGRRDHRVC